ncbi:hypothetical protein Vafri_9363 [Volvox africanus]|nr:hypothetical protein Vafri_9363 [Volvox africanus]
MVCNGWEAVIDTPTEKPFLEMRLSGWSPTHKQAPQQLKRFWQALMGLDAIKEGRFLNLPSDVYLLGRESWGSSLLVRQCYRGLFNRMMELRSPSINSRFLITGTPGIGKSFFAIVLMGWLAKEKEVSMIVLDLEDKRYLFTAKGTDINVAEGRKTDFNEEIENPTTWCIVDTGTATKRAANTVMLSFPDRELYKEFLKFPGTKTLYMPFWTRSEIHKCRKRLYPNLGKQTVNSLLEKWGNIPRYVLEKAMDAVAQRSLEDAIAFCRWEDIMHCVGEPETALHAAHKLVHFKVAAGKQYDQFIMNMASYYVVDKIAEKDGDNHVKHLWDLIDLATGYHEPGTRWLTGRAGRAAPVE